jgi:hypothetical protein
MKRKMLLQRNYKNSNKIKKGRKSLRPFLMLHEVVHKNALIILIPG